MNKTLVFITIVLLLGSSATSETGTNLAEEEAVEQNTAAAMDQSAFVVDAADSLDGLPLSLQSLVSEHLSDKPTFIQAAKAKDKDSYVVFILDANHKVEKLIHTKGSLYTVQEHAGNTKFTVDKFFLTHTSQSLSYQGSAPHTLHTTKNSSSPVTHNYVRDYNDYQSFIKGGLQQNIQDWTVWGKGIGLHHMNTVWNALSSKPTPDITDPANHPLHIAQPIIKPGSTDAPNNQAGKFPGQQPQTPTNNVPYDPNSSSAPNHSGGIGTGKRPSVKPGNSKTDNATRADTANTSITTYKPNTNDLKHLYYRAMKMKKQPKLFDGLPPEKEKNFTGLKRKERIISVELSEMLQRAQKDLTQ